MVAFEITIETEATVNIPAWPVDLEPEHRRPQHVIHIWKRKNPTRLPESRASLPQSPILFPPFLAAAFATNNTRLYRPLGLPFPSRQQGILETGSAFPTHFHVPQLHSHQLLLHFSRRPVLPVQPKQAAPRHACGRLASHGTGSTIFKGVSALCSPSGKRGRLQHTHKHTYTQARRHTQDPLCLLERAKNRQL